MTQHQPIHRNQVDPSKTWDLTDLFADSQTFEKALKTVEKKVEAFVEDYSGAIDTPVAIAECLIAYRQLAEDMSLLGTYAHLALSVDHTDGKNAMRRSQTLQKMAKMRSQLAFVESTLMATSDEGLREAATIDLGSKHYLDNIIKDKAHALEPAVEKTLSAFGATFALPETVYNSAKLADMTFPNVEVDGHSLPLSYNLFETQLDADLNTRIRREAFNVFSDTLRQYQHTTAAVYNGQVTQEKTEATLRGYDSVLDFLLDRQEVTRELYDRQIDIIMKELAPVMRKYVKHLKTIHNLDTMTYADLKLEVDPDYESFITEKEAIATVADGLQILGDDYTDMVKRAYDERWIDFANNIGKSTGAFCSSPYGSHPFILINWSGRMTEVMTLAHELGHAGNFYLAHQTCNIAESSPSMYVIEAPSTTNELIMANYMVERAQDTRTKRYLLSQIISKTYYHNFVTHLLEAAYQREVYRMVDEGKPVGAEMLNAIFANVLKEFWGEEVELTPGAELTWMRQPHYYRGLYPYTYSAGLTIGTMVSQRILKEGKKAVEDWREVLYAGGKLAPLDYAKTAGVDLTTAQPLLETIAHIDAIVDQIIALTEELQG